MATALPACSEVPAGSCSGIGDSCGVGSSGDTGGSGGAAGNSGGSSGSGGGAAGAGGSAVVEPQGTSLLLHVLDSSGAPIPSAAVTVQGSRLPTDGAGYIFLDNLAPGRFVARVESWGYAPASAVVELPAGVHGGTEVRLLPLGSSIPFDATTGAVLDQGPIRVTIPPAGLVDRNGEPVTGMVEATIVPIDPTLGLDNLPGPLEGIAQSNGATVGLESIAMADVTLWQDGLPVQLAPGKPAVLEMMLPDAVAGQYQVGQTIPAWWLDLDAGQWREEGVGTIKISSSNPGKLGWVVAVDHFTWWNCDGPWTDKHCFDVLVEDSMGASVPNMWVNAEGINYQGSSTPTYTNGNGDACVNIKRSATAKIRIGTSLLPFASTTVTGMGPAADCQGNGGSCTQITMVIPNYTVCSPGAFEPCTYSGPAGTEGVGICTAARKYCNITGTAWTSCEGEVQPKPEDCNSPFDDDCDGLVNEEGAGCRCDPGSSAVCYAGPVSTINVGICKGGAQVCQTDGKGYGPCVGQVQPTGEICATPEDDNCDGSTTCSTSATWSKMFGNTGEQSVGSVAVDGAGNIVITGYFVGTVDFGGGLLTSLPAGSTDIFVAKFAPNGDHIWSKQLGDASNLYANAVAIDSAGNIVITGYFLGTVSLGGTQLTSAGSYDIYVAKFGPSGNHIWSKRFGNSYSDHANSVAIDNAGNVVVTAESDGTVDFGGGPLTSLGIYDIFVAKFGPNGNHIWSKRFGDTKDQRIRSAAFDSAGNVVITGYFEGTVDFGGGALTAPSYQEIFVAKLDANGNHIWSKRSGNGNSGQAWSSSVAIDNAGNVAVTGFFKGTIDFGGGPLTVVGAQDIFVAKLGAANGNHIWSKRFGIANGQSAGSVAIDGANNVLISGSISGATDFGGGPLVCAGLSDVFVAKFDAYGNHVWSERFGDADDQAARSMKVDSAGNVVVTGKSYGGTIDFGNGPLTSMGVGNTFVVKLTP